MVTIERKIRAPYLLFENPAEDPDGFPRLLFHSPVRIIQAHRRRDVVPALNALDRAVRRGYCAAGYLAYEAGYALDERLRRLPEHRDTDSPLLWFGLFERAFPVDDSLLPTRLHRSERRYRHPPEPAPPYPAYAADIRTIRRSIAGGDVYQINHTFRTVTRLPDTPVLCYHRLKRLQPTGFAALVFDGRRIICTLSPELFFRRAGSRIVVRPMKGTAPRGTSQHADRLLRERLASDTKNRAENLMIVDLLRNDLGRVCRIGSVQTTRLFSVETYPTLHQMTSTVEGRLRPGISYTDIFTALFPSGSVTGAPKLRAMEIIGEVERTPRGVYTGAIGCILPGNTAVFNVAIRTLDIRGATALMGTGGGIVWDSRAHSEYRECLLKTAFIRHIREPLRLIETMLLEDGRCAFLRLHLERITHSSRTLGFRCDRGAFLRAVRRAAHRHLRGRWRLRLLLDARGHIETSVAAIDHTASPTTPRIAFSHTMVRSDDALLRHKTTDRAVYEEALTRARHRGLTDVLFTNQRGEVTEGCIHNLFIEKNGRLLTPPMSCGLLDGVMRRHILQTARNAEERILTPDDVRGADAVYLSNAVRGFVRVELRDVESKS